MRRFLAVALAVAVAAVAVGVGVGQTEAAPLPNAGGPYAARAGQMIQFSAVNSVNAVSFHWSFGDGTTAQGVAPVKAYAAAGVYTVTLTTLDQFGAAAVAQTTASISQVPVNTVVYAPSCAPVWVNGVLLCTGYPFGSSFPQSVHTFPPTVVTFPVTVPTCTVFNQFCGTAPRPVQPVQNTIRRG